MYAGLARVYDMLMADIDRSAWAQYICELMGDRGKASVADCACGTGALTIPLAKLGYNMTGLDISSDMLEIAAANARAARVDIPFVRQDMQKLALHKPAGAIICVCDGVNYLSLRGAESFFKRAYACLKENGVLLFDISTRYKLSEILGNNTFGEDEVSAAYIWKNTYDPKSRLVNMELTLFERQRDGSYIRFTESHIQRAHSQGELTNALKRAGFSEVEAFAAFSTLPPAPDTERIQFRAVKRSAPTDERNTDE